MSHRTLTAILIALASIGIARAEVKVGDLPPDALGVDGKGADVVLSAHRGKVVVLSFWASWCTYCIKELPVLEKVQRVLGKDRIEVIAVNIDRNRSDFMKMRRQLRNFEFTMARDEAHTAAKEYGANLLPFLVMVDKTGHVAYVHTGYSEEQLDGFVEEINGLLDESAEAAARRAGG
ncbi:MAG: TlpA family protein disulfide reductase [Rhodanobacteraceae bacterium]